MDPLTTLNFRAPVPQSQPVDKTQVPNSAGGFVFAASDEERLRRFLFLGVDGGTFYIKPGDLAKENAEVVTRLAKADGKRVVDIVRDISLAGRAPRQNATLFTLAAVSALGDDEARRYALDALSDVARTGTHLFLFARYVEQFRGWGRGLRKAVANWYTAKTPDALALQAAKYRQREGWSHRDLLSLSHPTASDPAKRAVFDFIMGVDTSDNPDEPGLLAAFRLLQEEKVTPQGVVQIIRANPAITWEMLPDRHLGRIEVWEALLDNGLPITALLRQLPRLTNLGLTQDSTYVKVITDRLTDAQALAKGRVHPVAVLLAMKTYASGRSLRGESTWTPTRQVVDALDAAFYKAFGGVQPSGKRTLLALDVSGSMGSPAGGLPISCRDASAAIALVTAATEPSYDIVGFTSGNRGVSLRDKALTPLAISPRQRLDDAIRTISGLPFGGTDCSLPMTHALDKGLLYDTFVIYTDSETYAGKIHPHTALERYRQATGINAKCVVVGMASNGFTIANPKDPGMLDVVGFDASVPSLISEFSRGV